MSKTAPYLVAILAALAGIFAASCTALTPAPPRSQKDAILSRLNEMGKGLINENWDQVDPIVDRNYYGGYTEVRNQITAFWQNQNLMDIDFTIDRILEQDDLLNAQVSWRKTFLDQNGRPQKQQGSSEIILAPSGDTYTILGIRNDPFFK